MLVKMVSSKERDGSSLGHLVAEVKLLLQSGRQIDIVKISHSQNRTSDSLVRFGTEFDSTSVWFGYGPDETIELILSSFLGIVMLQFFFP